MKKKILIFFLLYTNSSIGQLNVTCNSWLSLPSYPSYVSVGDLDISGNQITVEALFIRTTPYSNGYNWAGDLVSKHVDPTDVNYLLRPNNAEITTTNGFFTTPPICQIQLNKLYHAAMVYDGISLKFYRNGYLMSQVSASGNLIQNNHQTRIGLYDALVHNTNLIGFINEVRIWNTVRSQTQIRTYMAEPLPNPTGQSGLLAYYSFNDLINKQGNAAWNGTIGGGATINATVPVCNYFQDSCYVQNTIGNIINSYTPVLALNPCENKITVENAGAFDTGDTVLIIQMKGAIIDSSNTVTFGTISDYKNAGNYEFNYVKSKSGNVIELKNSMTRQYDIPDGKVQLVRVPYYQSSIVSSTLTCLPWDGSKGGVLVFNVLDSITLAANIDVNGRGFRGGIDPFSNPSSYLCYENNFFYPQNPDLASEKGEGIAIISAEKSFGKGAIANGGGGGNSHNSGGGGGSNSAAGGFGGYNFESAPCNNTPFDNRGIGGYQLTYNTPTNKIFLGGGGGAGHTNNPSGFEAKGGNGAGIVIISANRLKSNGNKIMANGSEGLPCGSTGSHCHEGMGGGGAGGTVLLNINNYLDNVTVEANGGKGGDMTASGFLKVGPGGGGSGGIVWVQSSSVPGAVNVAINGGASGVATGYGNVPFGATDGATGQILANLNLPVAQILFKPNIDSVRIKDSLIACSDFDFKGLGYTNSNPISIWYWDFGDGGTASTQNATYSYGNAGTYSVKLVVTDINGCKDSITRIINASVMTMDAGPGDTICTTGSTVLQSTANGASQYSWTPASYLNNPNILNPVAAPPLTTTFYLTAINAAGCSLTDSVKIEVRTSTGFAVTAPADICQNSSVQLLASGGDIYIWSPAASLNNIFIPNPVATPETTTLYQVNIIDTLCGLSSLLSTTVNVRPLPVVRAAKSNDIDCSNTQSQLNATGALLYNWTPNIALSNPVVQSPLATPSVSTLYTVAGTDINGCVNTDTITVKVLKDNKSLNLMPTAFTPNNDGLNDCFGIKYWGQILELEFSIFNRWGQRVFFTQNPSACWDGTVAGIQQNPGVFVYMIKAKTSCEDYVFKKGTFVLIR